MTIEPGKLYRLKSDGSKLMALEAAAEGYWRFYRYGGYMGCMTVWGVSDVEPWRDPVKAHAHSFVWLFEDGSYRFHSYSPGVDYLSGVRPEGKVVGCKGIEVAIVEGEWPPGFEPGEPDRPLHPDQ